MEVLRPKIVLVPDTGNQASVEASIRDPLNKGMPTEARRYNK